MSQPQPTRAGKVAGSRADRVKPGRIRRLYRLNALGIYDERLLWEVGEGLLARCRDALAVSRAMRGEVPCPACGHTVWRTARAAVTPRSRPHFPCPHCSHTLTWHECREALRTRPLCLDCASVLDWHYEETRLSCPQCSRHRDWRQYLTSVIRRLWLPCPHCRRRVRRPNRETHRPTGPAREPVECPECGAVAEHAHGRLSCAQCGYGVAWSKYRRRLKRRAEPLECTSCGHRFTWQSWRSSYRQCDLLTGRPGALHAFDAAWPRCTAPQEQMAAIDCLLHAVHCRGALAPVLIEGGEQAVRALLDELAAGG